MFGRDFLKREGLAAGSVDLNRQFTRATLVGPDDPVIKAGFDFDWSHEGKRMGVPSQDGHG